MSIGEQIFLARLSLIQVKQLTRLLFPMKLFASKIRQPNHTLPHTSNPIDR
jgi:hypothetical protein